MLDFNTILFITLYYQQSQLKQVPVTGFPLGYVTPTLWITCVTGFPLASNVNFFVLEFPDYF